MTADSAAPGHRKDRITAGIVTKQSPVSVHETVERCLATINAKGLKLFAVIDHGREAVDAGLELRETQVVLFGSPAVGTPVMASVPLAALELPLKVLIWADGDTTKVSYIPPEQLAARYGLSTELASTLNGINALTTSIVEQ